MRRRIPRATIGMAALVLLMAAAPIAPAAAARARVADVAPTPTLSGGAMTIVLIFMGLVVAGVAFVSWRALRAAARNRRGDDMGTTPSAETDGGPVGSGPPDDAEQTANDELTTTGEASAEGDEP